MELARVYDDLRLAGVEVIAVSSDPPAEAAALRERLALPFSVASDPDCATIRAWGIYHDDEPKGRDIARPATFLVEPDGTIGYRYVGRDKDDRPPVSEVRARATG